MSKELKDPGLRLPSNGGMTDLRNKLVEIFNRLVEDEIPLPKAKELSNAAGKIINTAKAQIMYCEARKETPDIPFMK